MFPPGKVYAGVSTVTTARRPLFQHPQAIALRQGELAARWSSTGSSRRLGRFGFREDSYRRRGNTLIGGTGHPAEQGSAGQYEWEDLYRERGTGGGYPARERRVYGLRTNLRSASPPR
jgi:hypothetical protein